MPMPGGEAQKRLTDAIARSESLYELFLRLPKLADSLENNEALKDNEFSVVETVRALRQDNVWELLHSMSPKVIKSIIQGTVAYDAHPNQNRGLAPVEQNFPCFATPTDKSDAAEKIPGVYVVALSRQGQLGDFLNIREMKLLINDVNEYIKGYKVHARLRTNIASGRARSLEDLSPDDQIAIRHVVGIDHYSGAAATLSNTSPPIFITDDDEVASIEALADIYQRMCNSKLDPTEEIRVRQSPLYVGCSHHLAKRTHRYTQNSLRGINKPLGLTLSIMRSLNNPLVMNVFVVIRTWKSHQLPVAEQLITTLAGSLVYQHGFNATEAGGTGRVTFNSGEALKTNIEYVMSRVGFIRPNVKDSISELEIRKKFLDILGAINDEMSEISKTLELCSEQLKQLPPSLKWNDKLAELREILSRRRQDLEDQEEAAKFWEVILKIQEIGIQEMNKSIIRVRD